jgi:predicted enzyme related to lactoylglutathione lyase
LDVAVEDNLMTRRVPLIRSAVLVALGIFCGIGSAQTPGASAPVPQPKEKVLGIGGFFFRAADPKTLAQWYETHLGIRQTPTSYDQEPWRQEEGFTVFGPFPANTKYFGDPAKSWMVNFRVRSLDAMAAQLRSAGITVEVDPATYPNGRFARLTDPEGNPIQLWEPKTPAG